MAEFSYTIWPALAAIWAMAAGQGATEFFRKYAWSRFLTKRNLALGAAVIAVPIVVNRLRAKLQTG